MNYSNAEYLSSTHHLLNKCGIFLARGQLLVVLWKDCISFVLFKVAHFLEICSELHILLLDD